MSKQSASKSRSKKQLAEPQTRFYGGTVVHWQGEGIYMQGYHAFYRIVDIKDMEFKMKSKGWGDPVYLQSEDLMLPLNERNNG